MKERSHHAEGVRWPTQFWIAAAVQILVLPPLQAVPTKPQITDRGITSAVEAAFILEKGVTRSEVDVSTSQGIVTISGSVDNILAKERAVKIAETIRGVLGVIDRIAVTAMLRPDEDVRKDILAALKQDPATESYHVMVSVQDGIATLTGSVGSYAERQLTVLVAEGVKGIKEVRSDVTINYSGKRTDSEIAADVKALLEWDVWINGNRISASVKDGKVALMGTLGSAISKSRAVADAWVIGVTSVDDSGLKIEPWARKSARREPQYALSRSDGDLKRAVEAGLRLDPRVSLFSPGVTVEGGVVTLEGTVGNLKAKASAEQDARSMLGVWRVDNRLKVRLNDRNSNAETEKQLKAALSWDAVLDGSRIDVAVINRSAYLSGTLDSSIQKAEAQDVASRTKGVLLVRNHLKIEPESSNVQYDWPYYSYYDWPFFDQPPYSMSSTIGPEPYLSDGQIKKNIEDALLWSPFVDRDDVKVNVHGGVVTLNGTVGTWIGWGEADKDAHKSGAAEVLNQVKVKKGHWW